MFLQTRILWRINRVVAPLTRARGLPPTAVNAIISPVEHGVSGCTFVQYCNIYKRRGAKFATLQVLISLSRDWYRAARAAAPEKADQRLEFAAISEAAAVAYATYVLHLDNAEELIRQEIEDRIARG